MKAIRLIVICLTALLISACSSNDSAEDHNMGGNEEASKAPSESGDSMLNEDTSVSENVKTDVQEEAFRKDRKVIFNAFLNLRVDNFKKAQSSLEAKAESYGGYIVNSQTNNYDDQLNGNMVFRIPDNHFQDFLHDSEGIAAEVTERQVTGNDVTEEYVDLESRLKSKRTVEARLLDFMKDAAKTEDLLKISEDLNRVQEEIEQLLGRIKYIDNQTAYSTVTINMMQNLVYVPKVDSTQLNTWEKTKKQFATSLNFLLVVFSGSVIFLAGNLPIFLIGGLLGWLFYFIYKRKKDKRASRD